MTTEVPRPKNPPGFMQIFDLLAPTALDASPDGSWVVYSRVGSDVRADRPTSTLWRLDVDGSDHRPLTGMSGGAASGGERPVESGAQVSPDGRRVAFISTVSGTPQIHLWEKSGATSQLTDLAHAPSRISWSRDGQWLAFYSSVPKRPLGFAGTVPSAPPGCEWAEPPYITDELPYKLDGVGFLPRSEQHLFVVPASGGAPIRLTSSSLGFTLSMQRPAWDPHGTEIFVIGCSPERGLLSGRFSDVFSVDVEGQRDPVQITEGEGMVGGISVSPDGSTLAIASSPETGRAHSQSVLSLLDRQTGHKTTLGADLDRALGEMPLGSGNPIEWTSDSSGIWTLYSDRGNTTLGLFRADGSHEAVLRDVGSGISGYATGTAAPLSDGRIVYASARGGEYPDLYLFSPSNGERTRLTSLNAKLEREHPISEYEEIWVDNPEDGQAIHAWLVKPPDFNDAQSYPLILDIHGGPHADYGDRFWLRAHAMAGQGTCVLLVNPRGSTSYGEEFTLGIEYTYPGPDVGDLLAVVDHVAQRTSIDEDRLFVMGGSGGGVLTAALVAATDRFRAAASFYPVIDWSSFMLSADITPVMRFWFERMPWQDPEAYAARSLIRDIERVSTPTLVLCGADDHRTPFGQAEILYQALTFAGAETALVRFPGEGHGISARPSHNVQMLELILGWFREHGLLEEQN